MTDEQINRQIAEACGWAVFASTRPSDLLNYCNCLNAMHEAQAHLNADEFVDYIWNIMNVCHEPMQSTARQRAESFLRALGKWKEDK
jgi:hypothetical protein